MPQKSSLRWTASLALWLVAIFATVSCVDTTFKNYNNGGTGVAIDFVVRLRGLALVPSGAGTHTYLGHAYTQLLLSYGSPKQMGSLYLYAGSAEGLEGNHVLPSGAIPLTSSNSLRFVSSGEVPLFQPFNQGTLELSTYEFQTPDGKTVSYLFTKTASLAAIAPGSAVTYLCSSPALSGYAALVVGPNGAQGAFTVPTDSTPTFLPMAVEMNATKKVFAYASPGGGFYEVAFATDSRSCNIRVQSASPVNTPAYEAQGFMLSPANIGVF